MYIFFIKFYFAIKLINFTFTENNTNYYKILMCVQQQWCLYGVINALYFRIIFDISQQNLGFICIINYGEYILKHFDLQQNYVNACGLLKLVNFNLFMSVLNTQSPVEMPQIFGLMKKYTF